MANVLDHAAADRSAWTITSTCRRCRAAWNLAPGIIGATQDGKAVFRRQPETEEETMQAWRAALACPTGSILAPHGLPMPEHVFPQLLAENVYRLGYNDNSTAGAHPFFIRSKTGKNFLIDGPRYVPKLVEFFEQQGGLDHVLLTHRDDVGAAAKYAERFGAPLWIHENDRSASPEATNILTGYAITEPIPGVTVIPIPGHTIGAVAFLIDEKLFVGDSLTWELDVQKFWTNPERCWDDWEMHCRSLNRLPDFRFDYMLAGHGGSVGFPHERMQAELATFLATLDGAMEWKHLTHLPTRDPIPDSWKQIWREQLPGVKTDFFAAVGRS
jgi:glyoxylase-like metal-dependent hydrolase (beta-lactamase superfamily II)